MPRENPHDKLFKQTFSIASEAKAFVQLHLPKWISTNLDYRSFKRASESFVNEQLQEYFSDIIYTCRWKGGKEALQLSFILEHKSYVPGNILLQLLRYLLECYDHQYLQDSSKPFSLVVPVVIYHGKKDWIKRDFASYFKLPDERLKRYLPFFEYELVDLTKIADELIKDVNIGYFLRSTFLLFKHKDDMEYVKRESEEIFIFVQQKLNKHQKAVLIKSILIYISQAFKFSEDEFIAYTKTIPKMVEYIPGSVYDQITKRIKKENQEEVTMLKEKLKRVELERKKKEAEQKKREAARKKREAERKKKEAARKKREAERKKREAARKKKELEQKKVAAIASLKRLLDSFILMPKFSLAKTARVTGIKLNTVKQVKATLVNDTLLTSRKKINQLFFDAIKLSSVEAKKINQLIKECRSELKKTAL